MGFSCKIREAEYKRAWYLANKEKSLASSKRSYMARRNEVLLYKKEWNKKNKARLRPARRKRKAERLKTDIKFRLTNSLRKRLHTALKRNYKSGSAVTELGCSVEFFKTYLESKFKPGMTWQNYGRNGWHIDHIKPISSFDLQDLEQLKQACHYTNLQPLWESENCSKGNKYG